MVGQQNHRRFGRSGGPRKDGTRSQSGFTLLELMVVVVILSILALMIAPRVMDRPDQARVTRAMQDIRVIESALKLYRLDNFRYPDTNQGLSALVTKPEVGDAPANWPEGGYLDRLPQDPWGRPYHYLNPGAHGEFDIFSLGADGEPGGSGTDADIGNWQDS